MTLPPYPAYQDSGVEWLGDIPSHWDIAKLKQVFKLIGSGTTPESRNQRYYSGSISWVTTSELREATIYETKEKITREALAQYPALRLFPPNTILIAMYGATIGRIGILGTEATCNQACCALAIPVNVDVSFISYSLRIHRPSLVSLSYGGGQPNISRETIRNFHVSIPPPDEQAAIVRFLDEAERRIRRYIRAKQKLIKLLNEQKQVIIQQAVTRGLDPAAPMKVLPLKA